MKLCSKQILLIFVPLFLCCINCNSNKEIKDKVKYPEYSDEYIKLTSIEIEQKIEETDQKIEEQIKNIEENEIKKDERDRLFNQDSLELPFLIEQFKNSEKQEITNSIRLQNEFQRKSEELRSLETTSDFRIMEREIRIKKNNIMALRNDLEQLNEKIVAIDAEEINYKLKNLEKDFSDFGLVLVKLPANRKLPYVNFVKFKTQILRGLEQLDKYLEADLEEKEKEFIERLQKLRADTLLLSQRIKDSSAEIKRYSQKWRDLEKRYFRKKEDYADFLLKNKEILEFYMKRKYEYLTTKHIYEITLLEKEVIGADYKDDKLTDQVGDLKQVHHNLVFMLKKDEFDIADGIVHELKNKIHTAEERIAEIVSIGEIIQRLFENGVFYTYLRVGKVEETEEEDLQQAIATFYEHIPTLKEFLDIYPDYKIYVDGHADRFRYSTSYKNNELSRLRAFKAKSIFINAGIDSNQIIIDWFGKFHNRTIMNKENEFVGNVNDRRIEERIIAKNDSNENALNYLNFRNNLKIKAGNEEKTFMHRNGFWIEKAFNEINTEIIKISYDGMAYDSLVSRHPQFRSLMSPRKSPLYRDEKGDSTSTFRLGNQVELILNIQGKTYKVKICKEGAIKIEDIKIPEIISYLKEN